MSATWTIPNWPEPWEPEFEVPALEALARMTEEASPDVTCMPDFSIEGCAFVQFWRGTVNVGRACVARHKSGEPFYSAYFGATGDEFHGFSARAIAHMARAYETSIEDAPEFEAPENA